MDFKWSSQQHAGQFQELSLLKRLVNYLSFFFNTNHCLISQYHLRLFESETSIFKNFFFFRCGFRALTPWRCSGVFRDLIMVVALIAFLGSRKHEQMHIRTIRMCESSKESQLWIKYLELDPPVVHRWARKNNDKKGETFLKRNAFLMASPVIVHYGAAGFRKSTVPPASAKKQEKQLENTGFWKPALDFTVRFQIVNKSLSSAAICVSGG